MFGNEVLTKLASMEPDSPVVSIFARTDPRDPSNTSHNPGWEIALRNGLRTLDAELQAGGQRDDQQAFRALHERIENELIELEPGERGRSIVWFVQSDGATIDRITLQLPVRDDLVVWDARPFISPLVDVADRGARVGVVMVALDHVRLLQLEQGETSEPENSSFEIELGDWRPFRGPASGNRSSGSHTASHDEKFEARVDKQREKLYAQAAAATASRLDELGWDRIVIAAEGQAAHQFSAELPQQFSERVIATPELNLAHQEPHEIAEALEPSIEESWLSTSLQLVDQARDHALAGGAGSLGLEETLGSLAEGRVEHLLIDPAFDFAATGANVPDAIGGPPELLGERAVEAAIATSAKVTALPAEESSRLAEAGGIAALLRY